MRLTIKSVPKNILEIERFLNNLFETHQLNKDMYSDMLVSLTEAVNNAIVHGNALDQQKDVSIKSNVQVDFIRLTVSDEGPGFDPKDIPNPLHDENIAQIGGRGVMLMKALSSEVYFSNGGATVELVFKRR